VVNGHVKKGVLTMRAYGMKRTYARCRTYRKYPSSKIHITVVVTNRRRDRQTARKILRVMPQD